MKKLKSKEFIIGLSVIVALVLLFFMIDYLKGINLLNPANFYYASYDNVSGLNVSAPVTINGYKVGQVREISYDYDKPGKVKVLLAVNDKLKIPEDSYAVLSSTLLSGAYIDIKMGKSHKYIPKGEEVPTHEEKDLMASISQDVMPAVNTILPRVDSLLFNLNALVSDPALTRSINNLDGITTNVLGITQGLNTTVKRDVPVVMRNARSLTSKIDSVSNNLIILSNALKELPINATMDNVNSVSANLADFSRKLNNQNSTLGMLTSESELYDRLNRVSADIDSLIVDIKKNPKRYISIKLF